MTETTATTSLGVEIALSGTFIPEERETGPSYACGGTPGYAASVEDVAVTGLGALVRDPAYPPSHPRAWKTIDLLEGVDRKSEAFRKIADNILKHLGKDAETTLVDAHIARQE